MSTPKRALRSAAWFNDLKNPVSTAIHIERYLNSGMSAEELRSGKPIIGIAQSGSDLAPCNRHHLTLAERTKAGIREAGGVPFEFPIHPIHENGKRPTAALDRNLAYLGLVEILYGYPIDGVVLTTGCDKTTPAMVMAAAAVDIPAIVLSGGPMLNGWQEGERRGAGAAIWRGRDRMKAGEITFEEFLDDVIASSPSPGHCNTMGTALTMNSIAEALGLSLPGCAAIPAPHRERGEIAFHTGKRIVDMVWEDLKPSDILSPPAFLNAIRVCLALGGSTNAVVHLTAMAEAVGVECALADWAEIGRRARLLVNCQPSGEYLGEDFHRAGGVPAVLGELLRAGELDGGALTVSGKTMSALHEHSKTLNQEVIYPYDAPLPGDARFIVLTGNFFKSAILKGSVLTKAFRERYLQDPDCPNAFTSRVIVFEGPEDYHARINDPQLNIDEDCILLMRGCGPIGYPGSAEVVNMAPPDALLRRGVDILPCIGDGRQSGTSASPSILHVSPEAAAGGDLALVETGDRIKIDLNAGRVDLLISDAEFDRRRKNAKPFPLINQTPWQEIYRNTVKQLDEGAGLATKGDYKKIAGRFGAPRHSH